LNFIDKLREVTKSGIILTQNSSQPSRITQAIYPKERCERINLGYMDPDSIEPGDYANREDEGILLVPKSGETLYRLRNDPFGIAPADSDRTRTPYHSTRNPAWRMN